MNMDKQIVKVGAVAYHPRVVTIWESFVEHFAREGVSTDYVLYSNYESLVAATLAEDVDIAWNANTAFVALDHQLKGKTKILGMRDIDADFATVIVSSKQGGAREVSEIADKRLAVGARDCGHSTILPIHFLAEQGLAADSDYQLVRFESGFGKHGDTGEAELDAIRAVAAGDAEAAALGDITWEMFRSQGLPETTGLQIIWRSPTFYHCNFTALDSLDDDLADRWSRALLAMRKEDYQVRDAMELEGVQRWLPGDRAGYESLSEAMKNQGYLS